MKHLVKHLDYVLNLTKFAFRANRLLFLSIAISLFSVVIELLAIASVFPLMQSISGSAPDANGIISRTLYFLGFTVGATAFLWMFIILFAVRIITQLIGQLLSMYLSRRVLAQLCSRSFEQILGKLDIREINEKSIGFYISLAGDESYKASNLVMSITQFVSTAFLALLYFVAILKFSPASAGVILVFSLCSLIALYKVTKISHRFGGQQIELSRKANSVFLDSLNNIKSVRAFSAEKYVTSIQRELIFGYVKNLVKVDAIPLLTKMVPVLLLLVILGVGLEWGGLHTEGNNLAFIVTMIILLSRLFPTVGQGVSLLMRIASDAKSGRDVTSILNVQSGSSSGPTNSLGKIEHIDFCDVTFAYNPTDRNKVLRGISLKFESGKSYALVGKSGVGKSTLVDILLKFYLPTSGHLCINNEPISDVADSEVRKKIILVSQEAAIFDDTVNNNICFGMQASKLEIQTACELAGIHEVIVNMPEGYNTRLHYQGKNLSGGQRQRIGIARALLRKPEVLILDESTSALDKSTQEKVVKNILSEYSGKIVIFVTHDPHIMEQVDEIVNLEMINKGVPPANLMSEKVS